MKIITIVFFISFSAIAQIPKLPTASVLKDLSRQVLEACKEDKSKVKGCESYTELPKLKACLMTNEAALSEKCKTSLKLVK